jgi:probable HAF family extracellular repeat protein
MKMKGISTAFLALAFALVGPAMVLAGSSVAAAQVIYAPDFVSPVAYGVAMNDAGDMVGTSYTDLGCGPFCLPPLETVVWKAGVRIVLPPLTGFTGTAVTGINNQGWICGYVGSFDIPRAVVWKPNGNTYSVIDLGTLPGTNMVSAARGIDDQGRVVGFSSTSNLPPGGAFLWTEAGGMVDLTKQGFPTETPVGISRGGTVATSGHWYHLGDPTSVTALAPVPPGGFFGFGGPAAINDAGDQARFLCVGQEHPVCYGFRYHHEGVWQQIDFAGTGPQGRGGVGSINNAQDITDTVSGGAQIAYGPDGINQPLDALFSPAYGSPVIVGGPMNASKQILGQIWLGLAGRLVRLTPVTPCGASCIRVSNLVVSAKFHQDPADPGNCRPGNIKEYNLIKATATVTSETGAVLSGVVVSGRFMDQYWTNKRVSRTTNTMGIAKFNFKGPCGVGTEAFIVENAKKAPLVFDKTVGVLAGSALPKF